MAALSLSREGDGGSPPSVAAVDVFGANFSAEAIHAHALQSMLKIRPNSRTAHLRLNVMCGPTLKALLFRRSRDRPPF